MIRPNNIPVGNGNCGILTVQLTRYLGLKKKKKRMKFIFLINDNNVMYNKL